MSTDPTTWDLEGGAPFVGTDEATLALIEALRRYGAKSVEFGYRWDPAWGEDTDDADPPLGVPVTWFATVTLESAGRRKRQRHRWTDTAEVVSEPGGLSHINAAAEALACLVRRRGGHVTVVHA